MPAAVSRASASLAVTCSHTPPWRRWSSRAGPASAWASPAVSTKLPPSLSFRPLRSADPGRVVVVRPAARAAATSGRTTPTGSCGSASVNRRSGSPANTRTLPTRRSSSGRASAVSLATIAAPSSSTPARSGTKVRDTVTLPPGGTVTGCSLPDSPIVSRTVSAAASGPKLATSAWTCSGRPTLAPPGSRAMARMAQLAPPPVTATWCQAIPVGSAPGSTPANALRLPSVITYKSPCPAMLLKAAATAASKLPAPHPGRASASRARRAPRSASGCGELRRNGEPATNTMAGRGAVSSARRDAVPRASVQASVAPTRWCMDAEASIRMTTGAPDPTQPACHTGAAAASSNAARANMRSSRATRSRRALICARPPIARRNRASAGNGRSRRV